MDLDALKAEERRFFDSHPYGVRVVKDHMNPVPDIVNELILVDRIDPVPVDFQVSIGQVLYNLRSALDHLAWQLVIANNGNPGKSTSFPIVDDVLDERGNVRTLKIGGGVHPNAWALIEAAQPYHRTDDPTLDPLWILNELGNIDKHRLLIVLAMGFDAQRVNLKDSLGGGVHHVRLDEPRPLKPGTYLGTFATPADAYDPQVQMDYQVSGFVAFHEREVCASKRVTDVLEHLLQAVMLLVAGFNAMV